MEKVEYPFKTGDFKGWRFSQVTKGATSLFTDVMIHAWADENHPVRSKIKTHDLP